MKTVAITDTKAVTCAGFPSPDHNHAPCLAATLNRAKVAFETQGRKLTDLRLRVFEQIAAAHRAIGAYDIINRLAIGDTKPAPISVYRAIEALMTVGVVHRLESRNAYFACHNNHLTPHETVILACLDCGTIAEVEVARTFAAIDALADQHRFTVATRSAEILGRCAHCESRRSA